MKVTLRKKRLGDGRESLHLDIYRGQGMRSKETLGLYLTGDKKSDRDTLRIAEQVRTRRQADIDAGRLGIAVGSGLTLGDHFDVMARERVGGSGKIYRCVSGHLERAGICRISLGNLTAKDCDKFRRHLLRMVEDREILIGTASTYMQVFRVAIRQAYRHGDIIEPLYDKFDNIRGQSRLRAFLSLDEARRLIATPFKEPYRSIILFAVLTGLRKSELKDLKWADIEGDTMRYWHRKTKKWSRRKIPAQANDAIDGLRGLTHSVGNHKPAVRRMVLDRARDGYIWAWYPSGCSLNDNLQLWADTAGIAQDLTMHCLRHTFATLQLSAGTPVQTVSALLSHSNIKTTQIYLNILDSAIDEAADRVIL